MRLVNLEGGTGAGFIEWFEEFGITSAGKTGTAEYCDNIAIERDWCIAGEILPTHSWYVGYAPFENPEIVVAAFIFNGDEGSQWAAPVAREVMAAYFQIDSYAPVEEEPEDAEQLPQEGVPPEDTGPLEGNEPLLPTPTPTAETP
jgi:penicillin-binding protein 2